MCRVCPSDADFIAFKQQVEGEHEFLPSADVQLELKEQAKKAQAGKQQPLLPKLGVCHRHTPICQNRKCTSCACQMKKLLACCVFHAEPSSKPKVTPLMQFLYERHSLKPEKKAPVMVPMKKVGRSGAIAMHLLPVQLSQSVVERQVPLYPCH